MAPKLDPMMGRYLHTLNRVAELGPRRVYPGHGPVIEDAAARAHEITGHHDERLDATADALEEGAETAYDAAHLEAEPNDLAGISDEDLRRELAALGVDPAAVTNDILQAALQALNEEN